MDLSCFSLSHLESLSTTELIGLADKHDIDIPPDLDRAFIIEELLDLNQDSKIKETEESDDLQNQNFHEIAALPKHYNFSFVDVLIRDPLWVFVFWEINKYSRNLHEMDSDFEGYCLRIIPNKDNTKQENNDLFVISISEDDNARYIGLPRERESSYKIELCVRKSENYSVLAVSRPFTLPRLLTVNMYGAAGQAANLNPLIKLSGVYDFYLIHDEDRVPRTGLRP